MTKRKKVDKHYYQFFRDDAGIIGELVHDLELAENEVKRLRKVLGKIAECDIGDYSVAREIQKIAQAALEEKE